jgi:hypothetical protein
MKILIENLKAVFHRLQVWPSHVWNMDETGIGTVQKLDRVTARRGFKEIGRIVSRIC